MAISRDFWTKDINRLVQDAGEDATVCLTDRLKEIDQFRHAIVHRRIDPLPFDVIDAVAFMERTEVYLSTLVTHRHGLKLGPDAMNSAF